MLREGSLIDRELGNLKKVFPDLRRKDFHILKNGNYCVQVSYITKGKYACGKFDILIEFPYNYPVGAPHAWIQKPKIPKETPHVYSYDKYGHADICYLRPKKDWHYSYTSYETSAMIEIWLATYCHWTKTGIWDWPEAGFLDHLF
ncbi:MAG: hypothetical protein ACFE8U_15910 [Candidatus Hermodarchaeota archaeon]